MRALKLGEPAGGAGGGAMAASLERRQDESNRHYSGCHAGESPWALRKKAIGTADERRSEGINADSLIARRRRLGILIGVHLRSSVVPIAFFLPFSVVLCGS